MIPLLAFAFNEISGDFGPAEGPRWAKPEFGTWIKLLLTPEVQRPLYPLLGFCVAAYFAAVYQRRRAPWITAGLGCGVVLSALFCVVYGLTIPFSVVLLVVFGLGLLGLSPLIVFVLYSQAWFHDRVPPHDPAPRRRWLAGVGAALGYSLWRVAVRTAEAHARLPVEPPDDCYVATATARAARWAGAEVVTFPGGRQAPVSRQLRVLKAAEQVIAHAAPRTHWALRVVYDRVGPPIAHRLGPRSGALAWLLLLPAQWASECALRLLGADLERLLTRVYPEADSTGPGGA